MFKISFDEFKAFLKEYWLPEWEIWFDKNKFYAYSTDEKNGIKRLTFDQIYFIAANSSTSITVQIYRTQQKCAFEAYAYTFKNITIFIPITLVDLIKEYCLIKEQYYLMSEKTLIKEFYEN